VAKVTAFEARTRVKCDPPSRKADGDARLRRRTRKGGRAMESRTARTDRPPLARPAPRGRVPVAREPRRHPHRPTDARPREHSADPAVPQRDGRGTAKRIGGELEKRKPAASAAIRKLTGPYRLPDCPRFVPGSGQMWLRGRATAGTCSCGVGRFKRERRAHHDILPRRPTGRAS
jgi:hypothetical protein